MCLTAYIASIVNDSYFKDCMDTKMNMGGARRNTKWHFRIVWSTKPIEGLEATVNVHERSISMLADAWRNASSRIGVERDMGPGRHTISTPTDRIRRLIARFTAGIVTR